MIVKQVGVLDVGCVFELLVRQVKHGEKGTVSTDGAKGMVRKASEAVSKAVSKAVRQASLTYVLRVLEVGACLL